MCELTEDPPSTQMAIYFHFKKANMFSPVSSLANTGEKNINSQNTKCIKCELLQTKTIVYNVVSGLVVSMLFAVQSQTHVHNWVRGCDCLPQRYRFCDSSFENGIHFSDFGTKGKYIPRLFQNIKKMSSTPF